MQQILELGSYRPMIFQYYEILLIIGCLRLNIRLWNTDNKTLRSMVHPPRYQSLLKMMSYLSMETKRKNYSSSDFDKSITKIKAGDISQEKSVSEYVNPRPILERTFKMKMDNVTEKSPGQILCWEGKKRRIWCNMHMTCRNMVSIWDGSLYYRRLKRYTD